MKQQSNQPTESPEETARRQAEQARLDAAQKATDNAEIAGLQRQQKRLTSGIGNVYGRSVGANLYSTAPGGTVNTNSVAGGFDFASLFPNGFNPFGR